MHPLVEVVDIQIVAGEAQSVLVLQSGQLALYYISAMLPRTIMQGPPRHSIEIGMVDDFHNILAAQAQLGMRQQT